MSSTTPDNLTSGLQAFSVLAIALAAGTQLSTSLITLPALLHAPSPTLAKQWKILFDQGITPVVTLTMTSAAGFATLAYRATYSTPPTALGLRAADTTKRNLYIAAAAAAFGLVPYTRLLMWSNIAELEKLAAAAGASAGKETTHALVREWGTLNLYRGCMLFVSAACGMWAVVS